MKSEEVIDLCLKYFKFVRIEKNKFDSYDIYLTDFDCVICISLNKLSPLAYVKVWDTEHTLEYETTCMWLMSVEKVITWYMEKNEDLKKDRPYNHLTEVYTLV